MFAIDVVIVVREHTGSGVFPGPWTRLRDTLEKEENKMSQSTAVGARFRTGQECVVSGRYAFDGYLDGTTTPAPTPEERQIPLSRGETFPPIRSSGKACWWKLVQKI